MPTGKPRPLSEPVTEPSALRVIRIVSQKPAKRLVDGIIHDFIDQMMQTALVRGADIHARTAAHGLQPLENLDLTLVVMIFVMLNKDPSHPAGRAKNFSYYYIIPLFCTFFHTY